MQQTSGPFLPVEAKCIKQPILHCLVFVTIWWSANEIYQARGSLLVKDHDDIHVFSVVGHCAAEVKLGLGLNEADLRLGGPEG